MQSFPSWGAKLALALTEKIGNEPRPLSNHIDQERTRIRSLRNSTVLRGRQILWLVLDALKNHDETDPYMLAIRDMEAIPAPQDDTVSRLLTEWTSEVSKTNTRCANNPVNQTTFRDILLNKVKDCPPLWSGVSAFSG